MINGTPLRPGPGTYAGLFVVTLSTLLYELALTRIFSVVMWYHFAFMAISITLLGLTVGALAVHLLPDRFPVELTKRHLWVFSLAFSVAIPISLLTQLSVPFSPTVTGVGLYSVFFTCFVISIPFVFSGVVVCLSLTRFPSRVNRLYAADLAGAACGCILLVVLFEQLDGPSVIIATAGIGAVGALLFAWDAGEKRAIALPVACAIVLGGFAMLNGYLAEQRHPIVRIMWVKEAQDPLHDYEQWNAFSRITVDGDPAPSQPFGWGMSPMLPPDQKASQLALVIDGTAATVLTGYDGDPVRTDYLRFDITNLAHYLRQDADVMVVGVGGGRDILSALEFEQRSVTGAEINDEILHTLRGPYAAFTGHLEDNPKVTLVHDEARSYLTRTDEKFDIIQISLIDTFAATAAGAFALSENGLYTLEAWDVFFDRLKPGGMLTVSRCYSIAGSECLDTYRLAGLAAQSLKDRGVENPRDHVLLYNSPVNNLYGVSISTLIVSPDPLTAADVSRADAVVDEMGFFQVVTPNDATNERYARILDPAGPNAALDEFRQDLSPPTDNRPFFFQMASYKSLLNGSAFRDATLSDTQSNRPVIILTVMAMCMILLTVVFVGIPLVGAARNTGRREFAPFYLYFAGIGLAFLLVEISQLQRLNIFLGHPTYALTVVLFTILLSSGVGSMLSEVFLGGNRKWLVVVPFAALLAVVLLYGIVTPEIIERFAGEQTRVRLLVAVLIMMPMGVLMGMPFPIGMSVASRREGAPTALFWGINGAMSVCASVLAVAIALFFGISSAFWTGAVAYAIAAGCLALIVSRQGASVAATSPAGSPAA